jgi:glyoxylase-like metal-dependent hydrolase (beta-lactamase superfamily II)
MENVENISEDLFIVKQVMRPGWFCSTIVLLGKEQIGIIDTGFENTPDDFIFPLIKELGRSISEVNYIVNTHRDGDHIRGNEVIKEKTNAPIAIHELEAESVKTADIKLMDGDTVELGDRVFDVIHTPGHRPGSICLYDSEDKILITGDSVCGEREDLIRMDKNTYIKSLKKLNEIKSDIMIMSHPFKPPGKSILYGNEITEMIQTSITIAEKLNHKR